MEHTTKHCKLMSPRSKVTIEQITESNEGPERLTVRQVAAKFGVKPSTNLGRMRKA